MKNHIDVCKRKGKIIVTEGEDVREIQLADDHALPVTRRDFLKAGALQFSGAVMAPTLLSQILLRRKAMAQSQESTPLLPFLVFDLAGGASMTGNFLVGGQGGPEDLLDSYDMLGWNPRESDSYTTQFGLPVANIGNMYRGLRQTTVGNQLDNLRMVSFCHPSNEDGSPGTTTQTSALQLISKAGLQGEYVDVGVGTINTDSGGFTQGPLGVDAYKPLTIAEGPDLQSALSHGEQIDQLSDDTIRRLSQGINDLSREQLRNFQGLSDREQLESLLGSSFGKASEYGGSIPELDAFSEFGPINFVYSQFNQQGLLFGNIVSNVLQGNTGPGVLTIGGCDYHAPVSSAAAERKDLEIGQEIGRTINLASRLGTPFCFQIVTNGGVNARPGTRIWTADSNGLRGLTVFGVYDPREPREIKKTQIGHYGSGGLVSVDTIVGDDPEAVPNLILANYLSLSGRLDEFPSIATRRFGRQELESLLSF